MVLFLTFSSTEEKSNFDYIYNTYKKLMLHKAYGILHDYSLAEDAVSEAFIRIYKNIQKIDNPTSKSSIAFVMTIVKNTALTMLKGEKSHEYTELDDVSETSYTLENKILDQISAEEIIRALDSIGEELKTVFLLKYSRDLSHKQIAGLLGITENNVTVRVHRAKKKLAEVLIEGGYVYEN